MLSCCLLLPLQSGYFSTGFIQKLCAYDLFSHPSCNSPILKVRRSNLWFQIRNIYHFHFNVTSMWCILTFKNLASYIEDGRTATLQMLHFIYFFFNKYKYFKHAAHFPFFSSECRLFCNAIFFGSCVIQI
jgi:hypothetical protein